ncbi:MAG TPA: glycoside hydrolase family 1 protein, partial [Telluria sp.]|nr:glycoside hydrolase family 1 protein [Telluria sp.]
QVDWDSALRQMNGNVNALGLYDLDRHIRPVGTAYRELVHAWMEVLPTQSVCLQVPIVMPNEWDMVCELRPRMPEHTGPGSQTLAPDNTEGS